MIVCPKCGELFMESWNKKQRLCLDCSEPIRAARELSSLGSEDMVTHFSQDIGLRLQRMAWGHFK